MFHLSRERRGETRTEQGLFLRPSIPAPVPKLGQLVVIIVIRQHVVIIFERNGPSGLECERRSLE
jgi:hypothetical protein